MSIDCHKEFQDYLEKIKITETRKNNLKNSKNAIRNKIKDWFKNKQQENESNNWRKPLFRTQGSFSMKTLINQEKGDYDIDDGIYLENLDSDKDNWPQTETVHNWIKNAVDGHTNTPIQDKKNCIRVIYERQNEEDSYHVDLPIYSQDKNKKYYLARKGEEQWIESNSKDFDDWFKDKVKLHGEQFRKIIIYLKGWRDFKDYDVPGVVFTVLAECNFVSQEQKQRNDSSFFKTIKNICQYLENCQTLNRPVKPYEDIFDGWSNNKKEKLKEWFNSLKNNLENINDCTNKKVACEKYRNNIFGDRFPECDEYDDSEQNQDNKNYYRPITKPSQPWTLDNNLKIGQRINLTEADKEFLKNKYPYLIYNESEGKINGTINFRLLYKGEKIADSYQVQIELKDKTDSVSPNIKETEGRIQLIAKSLSKKMEDLHINSDGTLCLYHPEEEKEIYPNGFDLKIYLQKVEEFFYQINYYKKYQKFPWGEYAHGALAYLELFAEKKIDIKRLKEVIGKERFKKLNKIKGHHNCLCGSTKKLRNCHQSLYNAIYKIKK